MVTVISPVQVLLRSSSLETDIFDLPCSLIHLGQNSLLVRTENGVIVPITTPEHGIAPGGIQITPTTLSEIRSRLSTRAQLGSLMDLVPDIAESPVTQLRVPQTGVIPYIDSSFFDELYEQWISIHGFQPEYLEIAGAARKVSRVLLSNSHNSSNKQLLHQCLLTLVGAGSGATPAGDDILTGVLAAHLMNGGPPTASVTSAIELLLDRTTLVSAQQIRCVLNGQLASPFIRLCELLSDGESSAVILNEAKKVGHSSGVDFLFGLVIHASRINR